MLFHTPSLMRRFLTKNPVPPHHTACIASWKWAKESVFTEYSLKCKTPDPMFTEGNSKSMWYLMTRKTIIVWLCSLVWIIKMLMHHDRQLDDRHGLWINRLTHATATFPLHLSSNTSQIRNCTKSSPKHDWNPSVVWTDVCKAQIVLLTWSKGPVSQNLSSVTIDSLCYKLPKSLLLIGYQQICHWFLSFVIEKRLCETGPGLYDS